MHKGHILIVDDDKDFVKLVKFRLQKKSYMVTEAYDGKEAIARVKKGRPDMVLLDIKIPKVDGMQVLKTIIRDNPEIYVVIVTGHASLESAVEALRYGAHEYLIKPLENGWLETVNRCLEKVRLQRELKETQERLLLHSQKLAAIGQLATGVAHEIANPLAGIRGTAQLLLKKKDREEPEVKKLKMVEKETKRCQDILRRLLGFAKLPQPEILPTDINKIIDDTLLLLEPQAVLKKVRFARELQPHLPSIPGIADQLKQVFLNLILNAFHAMPGGGGITVSTSVVPSSQILSPKGRGQGEGVNFILIKFTDTGCGIPEENLEHLFDPFFTKGKTATGTGLGLAISYGIIHKHNGTIEVESEVGKGTTVAVKLPAAI